MQGYGEYFLTGQNGFGGYGGFGDVASDAQTIYNQVKSGDTQGAANALTGLSAGSGGPTYAQQVCQQMGVLATADDAAAAAQSGQVQSTFQNAVITTCTTAGVSTGTVPSTQVTELYQQLKAGQTSAVITSLQAMDATTRTNVCNQMGQLAYADDVAAATATSQVAYTNQNAVISACTAAGVAMPAPGGTTPPGGTPVVASAGMSTTSIVLLGAVGAGILYFVFKGA